MKTGHCHFCGYPLQLIHVHGHYQCNVCGTNALPCCDGDNCHTNEQLKQDENIARQEENYSQALLTTFPSIKT
jgi:hypothetical protein